MMDKEQTSIDLIELGEVSVETKGGGNSALPEDFQTQRQSMGIDAE